MVADRPDQPIELKTFCCRLVNDPRAPQQEEAAYEDLPVVREVTREMLLDNFQRVRNEIAALVRSELQRIENTPELQHLLM